MLTQFPAAHPWSVPEDALRLLEPILSMCEAVEQAWELEGEGCLGRESGGFLVQALDSLQLQRRG